tara:strand:- start:235 stop:1416 length:1182 start_codon:yes stop_codon:yes gene_type:complete
MNNIIILILVICLLFIYGIIFTIKNKQIKNIVESFIDSENTKSLLINPINILKDNKNIYLSRMNTFVNGIWTTDQSTVSGSTVQNIMDISISEDSRTLTLYNKTYVISYVGRGVIITETLDNRNLLINFLNFNNEKDSNQPFNKIVGLPKAIVYIQGSDEKVYVSYKLLNGTTLTEDQNELKRIIEKKIFDYKPPVLNYDIKTYNKLINNYRFPENMISFTDKVIPLKDITKAKIKKINTNYHNKVMFAYKRVYRGANNTIVKTQLSQRYTLPFLTETGLNYQIILKRAQEELLLNDITNSFELIGTEFYYFYISSDVNNIKYQNAATLNTSSSNMNLFSTIRDSFSSTVSYPDLNAILNTTVNNYSVWPFWFPTTEIDKDYTYTLWNSNLVL